jgi:hypothetical protein
MIFAGNKGNCGCFGEYLQMTPLQALIKNISMIVLILILYKYHEGWNLKGKLNWLMVIPLIISLAVPFIVLPVELDYSASYLNKPEGTFRLELDSLYSNAFMNVPTPDLDKGKHIITFMTLKCPHCRIAAKKIRIMKEKDPTLPVFLVLNGKKENLEEFFSDTGADNIPFSMLKARPFTFLSGNSYPAIYLVNNSVVEFQLDYNSLSQEEVESWLKK